MAAKPVRPKAAIRLRIVERTEHDPIVLVGKFYGAGEFRDEKAVAVAVLREALHEGAADGMKDDLGHGRDFSSFLAGAGARAPGTDGYRSWLTSRVS